MRKEEERLYAALPCQPPLRFVDGACFARPEAGGSRLLHGVAVGYRPAVSLRAVGGGAARKDGTGAKAAKARRRGRYPPARTCPDGARRRAGAL
ncbi:hypothetical protein [uncultured Parabacteroides sp.]|uniref:hypothetical protein n=1 Tax=uncultured Parabacteroides sp. TaxID=512312 RepID=UPI002639CF08|nr:hypothetical protein [uncultured Parabacteroides sp.]